MRLQTSPKYGASPLHRVVSPEKTLARVKELMPVFGITRVADITGLDRLGIPTFSAIVPESNDVLSVYNGKGSSKVFAKVGAIMEAAERNAALNLDKPLTFGSYNEVAKSITALPPGALNLPLLETYNDDKIIAWITGYDLLSDREVLVPAQAVTIVFNPELGEPCYGLCTTNGLASGNTVEEAVCHALAELIERDAWTLAELRARYVPFARARLELKKSGETETAELLNDLWNDDITLFPDIDLAGGSSSIRKFARCFKDAGIALRVKDITSDLQIPTVIATSLEFVEQDLPFAHFGLGTHLDPEVAVTRALTEVAQSRAVDIQGIREDIATADTEKHPYAKHTKRPSSIRKSSWYFKDAASARALDELPVYHNDDILKDINLMLDRLKNAGLEQAIAIDLTRNAAVPVVRLLVPGLESWAGDHGRLGQRAAACWKEEGLTIEL